MKKTILTGFLTIFTLSLLLAQKSSNEGERAVLKDDNVINVYYGTNIIGNVYKSFASSVAVDVKTKSFGPIGLVYEHMLTDIVGLGAEFSYSKNEITFYEQRDYGQSGGGIQTYEFGLNFTTIRAMFRANFHFAKNEKFDAYGLVSAGYRNIAFTYTTNDPYDTNPITYNSIIPIGVKPGIGFRYFFTPNFGLNLELAAGTPLMGGGLSFKF